METEGNLDLFNKIVSGEKDIDTRLPKTRRPPPKQKYTEAPLYPWGNNEWLDINNPALWIEW